ncbi:MAG: hypothetical protein M1444_03815 [Patescibacteria group bacterium]|nr:hypothetical protein [Patescibacteria group bacterium]
MFKNKTLVIVAAVVILALLGGVAYLTLSKSSKNSQENTQPVSQQQPTASPSAATGTLKSLFGKNQYCTVTYPNNGGSGTVYVSGQKFRGDFTVKTADGKEVTSQVLSDGVYTYVWSSDSPTGIKMKIDVTSPTASAQTGNFNLDQQVGLNCSAWAVDASKFAVPTNIKFTDVSAMIPKTSGAPTTGGAGFSCAGITDPSAKAACENALKSQNNGY